AAPARVSARPDQLRLAARDLAHDLDDRRPRLEDVIRVVERLGLLLLVGGVLDLDLATDLLRDQLHLLVAQRLRRRAHLAEAHEDLDDARHRDAERLRQVADADAGLDRHGTRRRRRGRAGFAVALRVLAGLPLLTGGTRPALVDDDAPPAPA